jgi:SAM-dependent methyltransferase
VTIPDTWWTKHPTVVSPPDTTRFMDKSPVRDAIEKFILDLAPTEVMDLGCNTGVLGYRLYTKGYAGSYVGVDSNAYALSRAMLNLTDFKRATTLIYSDLETLRFSGMASVVVVKDVIEHCANFVPVLKQATGYAVNYLVLGMFIKMHDALPVINPGDDGLHLNRYNRETVYSYIESRGYERPTVMFSQGEEEVLVFKRLQP